MRFHSCKNVCGVSPELAVYSLLVCLCGIMIMITWPCFLPAAARWGEEWWPGHHAPCCYQQQNPPLHITTSNHRWHTKSRNDKYLEITLMADYLIMFSPAHDQPDGYTGLFIHLCLRWSYQSRPRRTQHNVYGSFINLNSLHGSQSRHYSALHWRHLQNCKTASITTCLLK